MLCKILSGFWVKHICNIIATLIVLRVVSIIIMSIYSFDIKDVFNLTHYCLLAWLCPSVLCDNSEAVEEFCCDILHSWDS